MRLERGSVINNLCDARLHHTPMPQSPQQARRPRAHAPGSTATRAAATGPAHGRSEHMRAAEAAEMAMTSGSALPSADNTFANSCRGGKEGRKAGSAARLGDAARSRRVAASKKPHKQPTATHRCIKGRPRGRAGATMRHAASNLPQTQPHPQPQPQSRTQRAPPTAASKGRPRGKSGRSARSMRRAASTSCSLAAPSRLL